MSTRRPSPQAMAVLLDLAEQAPGWSHGYSLCGRLGIKPGTLYPILIRFAERGLVEAEWEQGVTQGRPPRHLYRVTRTGTEFAARLDSRSRSDATDATMSPATKPWPVIGMAGA